jgi:hypothetical protein
MMLPVTSQGKEEQDELLLSKLPYTASATFSHY